jgi:hypothetical protein
MCPIATFFNYYNKYFDKAFTYTFFTYYIIRALLQPYLKNLYIVDSNVVAVTPGNNFVANPRWEGFGKLS